MSRAGLPGLVAWGDRSEAYVADPPALVLGALGYVAFLWLDTLRANV
jgi:hypothetical protein